VASFTAGTRTAHFKQSRRAHYLSAVPLGAANSDVVILAHPLQNHEFAGAAVLSMN
jgi:hypothetical protein